MKFKDPILQDELKAAPLLLRLILQDLDKLTLDTMYKEITITRILGKIEGDSGVHSDYRAADIRDELDGKFTFSLGEREFILNYLEQKYHRYDGKPTVIWHSFNGGPHHLHIQISQLTKAYSPSFSNDQT